jgi:hypothetical protein
MNRMAVSYRRTTGKKYPDASYEEHLPLEGRAAFPEEWARSKIFPTKGAFDGE